MSFLGDKVKYFRRKKEVNHHAFGTTSPKNAKRYVAFAAVGFLAILAVVFIVRPAFTGYSIYQEIERSGSSPETYGSELSRVQGELDTVNANLATCQASSDTLSSEIESYKLEAEQARNDLQTQTSSLQNQVESLRNHITEVEHDREEVEIQLEEQEDLIHDAARRVCCFERVLDSDIASYDADGTEIECKSGSNGEYGLTC